MNLLDNKINMQIFLLFFLHIQNSIISKIKKKVQTQTGNSSFKLTLSLNE